MVALLRDQPSSGRPGPRLRLVDAGVDPGRPPVDGSPVGPGLERQRPALELVPGLDRPQRPSIGVIVAVALAVFGLFGAIRFAQGSVAGGLDAADTDGATSAVVAAEGDRVVVAGPGDSLWSIARSVAPDRDPRPMVAALIDANGGESVQIGQQIVIPHRLLD